MDKKRIVYSEHLRHRIKIRNIDSELPRKVFLQALHYFSDTITNSNVAVGTADYAGKSREIAVVFRQKEERILMITAHPLRTGERQKRVASGRWVKSEKPT